MYQDIFSPIGMKQQLLRQTVDFFCNPNANSAELPSTQVAKIAPAQLL